MRADVAPTSRVLNGWWRRARTALSPFKLGRFQCSLLELWLASLPGRAAADDV